MSILTAHHLVEGAMSKRLIHLLFLATALSVSGVGIVMSSSGVAPAQPVTVAAAAARAHPGAETITLLPTIVVRPEPVVPTLATITIRPEWASNPGFDTVAAGDDSPGQASGQSGTSAVTAMPGGGFDMPYYSFGKSLRRVSKE